MQGSELGSLSVRGGGWNGEPIRRVGKVERLPQVELRVVAESGGIICRWVAVAQYGEFAAMQGRGPLACPVGNPYGEVWCIVVEDNKYQRRSRLRSGVYVVGKMAPNDVPGGGFAPPLRGHADSTSIRLERTECFLPWTLRFLIWRS